MSTYLISDIHGCNETFRSALKSVALKKTDKLILLGDLIDRGPDTKGVLDYCFQLKDQGIKLILLKGNHEQMMLDALSSSKAESLWLRSGGKETLKSFGLTSVNQVDTKYFHFIREMGYYVELEDFILVHAGLNFSKKDPFEDKEAMLWARYSEVVQEKIDNKILVHGHTPYELSIIINQNLSYEYDICVDAGCVFAGMKQGMGHLVALELTEKKFYHQANIE